LVLGRFTGAPIRRRDLEIVLTRANAILGYLSIVIVFLGLALGVKLVIEDNFEAAKRHFIENAHADAVAAEARVRDKLHSIYENLRTLTLLPGVRNIDRDGGNLGEAGLITIQQVYNNLANSVAVSEVYIVPASFNPQRIDPATGSNEEPILMFDELIVNAASRLRVSTKMQDRVLEKFKTAQEDETYEYRQLQQVMGYLQQNYPTNASIKGLDLPIVSGPEVITCDNNTYIHTGHDKDRSGVMFSVPFFDGAGMLKGTVTAIILTNALQKMLPERDFALINPGYGYIVPSSKGGQEIGSIAWVAQSKPDPGLIYSEMITMPFADPRSDWAIWSALPNEKFHGSVEATNIRATETVLYAVIMALMLASFAWWWLIVRNINMAAAVRSQLEQRVAERTQEVQRLSDETHSAAMTRERLQMSRNLHDTLAHSMLAMLMQVRLMRKLHKAKPDLIGEELERAEQAAQEGLDVAREAIVELRYFAVRDDGLKPALEKLVKRLNDRVDINISLEVDAAASALAGPKAETLYRVAEEALHNIEKHADARNAAIRVTIDQSNRANHILKLTIEDDGRGFAPESSAPGGYGITGMREQASILGANLVIQSAPGKGTKIQLEINT
jgi:signal transduction histidine kinase